MKYYLLYEFKGCFKLPELRAMLKAMREAGKSCYITDQDGKEVKQWTIKK